MLKKFVLGFMILALALASAGTVPGVHSYTITLAQPAVVNGTQLKPGDYKLTVGADKITLAQGKTSLQVPAKVETEERKFDDTAIRVVGGAIAEIRVGGTRTKIILAP
jgi:hypothetical protein